MYKWKNKAAEKWYAELNKRPRAIDTGQWIDLAWSAAIESQLIDIKKNPPPVHKNVILRGVLKKPHDVIFTEGYRCGSGTEYSDWSGDINEGIEYTHWMEIPEIKEG